MGNIHRVEVVVHVDAALNEGQKTEMVEHLRGCAGVEGARFSPGHDQLLWIDYDRDRQRSKAVLDHLQRAHKGAGLLAPV